jgi:hypothetical protein
MTRRKAAQLAAVPAAPEVPSLTDPPSTLSDAARSEG